MIGFRGLRTRLAVSFLGLFAAIQIAVLVAVHLAATRNARAQVEEQLLVTGRVFERLLGTRNRKLVEGARLLASDFAFMTAVATRDAPTLLSAMHNHRARVNADVMMLVSLDRRHVADTLDAHRAGEAFAFPDLVHAAAHGEQPLAFVPIRGDLYQAVVAPVLAPAPTGWLLIGSRVDDGFARDLQQLTVSDISFLREAPGRRAELTASTLPADVRDGVAGAVGRDRGGRPLSLTLGGREYVTLVQRFGVSPERSVVGLVQRPLDEAIAPFRPMELTVLSLALAGLLVSVVAGLRMARSVSRPLVELTEGARRLERGDYDQRVAVPERDELGELATAFNNMAQRISEREEQLRARQARLETLLAVSRELSEIQPVGIVLQSVAHACGRLLGSDSVGFRRVEGDEVVLTATWGDAEEAMPTKRLKIGQSLAGRVAATGEPLVIADVANDPRVLPAHAATARRMGHRAWLGVPLRVGDRVVGVLSVRTRRPEGFTSDDVAVATGFAFQAATALENARLYEQLKQAYDELAETQGRLTQSQKMEAVGQLAGGLAHDFNNLLTVILGRTELQLGRLGPSDPARRDLELVRETAERARALTLQLVAFSRKQLLQPTILGLDAVVTDLEPMLRRLIGGHVQLVSLRSDHRTRILADRGQIEQVLVNLVVNACDAMPQGGRLTIATGYAEIDHGMAGPPPELKPGPYATLTVTDTGVGMDASVQARVFEPFFTTKDPGKGTGLGLSTVYGIVRQSGGYVQIESEPGRGTAFVVYLPHVDEAADAVTPPPPAELPRGAETVMLVEDDEAVRLFAREVLENLGYTVLAVAEPGEAIAMAAPGATIDLLVADVLLPQMSGPALARQLASVRPDLRVLYISGDAAAAAAAEPEFPAPFLPKPFTPAQLATKVRDVLNMSR